MYRKVCLFLLTMIVAAICPAATQAQNAKARIVQLPEGASTGAISPSGQWVLSSYKSDPSSGGTMFDIDTEPPTPIPLPQGVSTSSVSHDGNMFAGNHNGSPAVYNRATDSWTNLPVPSGYKSGAASRITPEGKFVLGSLTAATGGERVTAVWNVSDLSVRIPTNLPVRDMQNTTESSVRISAVSPNGRYLIGSINSQYMLPIHICSFIYDLDTQTYEVIGFTEKDGEPYPPGDWNYGDPIWEHHHPDLLFIEGAQFSANGKWVSGTAYMREDMPGVYYAPEYRVAYRLNMDTRELEFFNAPTEQDMGSAGVTDDGSIMAFSPALNPYSYTRIRYGNYYYPLEDILLQVYGLDLENYGIVNSGKPIGMSRDASTLHLLDTPEHTYLLRIPESLPSLCSKVDLLGTYTVTPEPGSVMTRAGSFKIKFNRPIETDGNAYSNVHLLDSKGNIMATALGVSGFKAEGNELNVVFRYLTLQENEEYELVIPEGSLWLSGDKSASNKEIRVKYIGRADKPVQMTYSIPASGSSIPGVDVVDNPLVLYFDAPVKVADNKTVASISIVGDSEPFGSLQPVAATSGLKNRILLYPVGTIRLYKGTNYEITIPAGTLTDLSGCGENEEIRLRFKGTYSLDPDVTGTLFKADGTDFNNMLFYEGDKRTPREEVANMGFDSETTPWWVVRESSTSTDMAYASHSMYTDMGQADDWMTTEQLYIPDEKVTLDFDAQSWREGFEDRLKVIVYERYNAINALTKSVVDDIRENGTVVYDEILSPGANEEDLTGEWDHVTIPLNEYAGKFIYICFVNENTNQSMVIVDNILVSHEMDAAIELTDATTVTDRDEHLFRGNLHVFSSRQTYTSVEMTLKNGLGETISHVSADGLSLGKGDTYSFNFPDAMPLTSGERHPYTITARLSAGAEENLDFGIAGEIVNLAFMPERRVVIEKYTGRDCGFCPSGIIATGLLEEAYGDRVLPIAIHTYQSDPKGRGMHEYMEYLGCSSAGAPSARIDRGFITAPAYTDNKTGNVIFSKAECTDGSEPLLWTDIVAEELATPTTISVDAIITGYDESTVNVKATVMSAINTSDSNLRVFAVLLEDKLTDYQTNYYYQYPDPSLGDWGQGGIYGSSHVSAFVCNNVGRQTWGESYSGTASLIPSSLTVSEKHDVDIDMPIPSYVENIHNCHVTVMLIDGNTGRIVNAADMSIADFEGVGTVGDDDTTPVWYDLSGCRVDNPSGGIFIRVTGGKAVKVLIP